MVENDKKKIVGKQIKMSEINSESQIFTDIQNLLIIFMYKQFGLSGLSRTKPHAKSFAFQFITFLGLASKFS